MHTYPNTPIKKRKKRKKTFIAFHSQLNIHSRRIIPLFFFKKSSCMCGNKLWIRKNLLAYDQTMKNFHLGFRHLLILAMSASNKEPNT